MKITRKRNADGGGSLAKAFTMIELTLAVAVSMLIATGCLMLLGLHTNYMREVNSFQFLRDEAPQVNSLVTQLVGKSDSYRIFASPGDAFAGLGAVNTGGNAVLLSYRNPSGLVDQSVIAFESGTGGGPELNYYRFQNGAWPPAPDWTITSQLASATFSDDTGVLLMALTGPEGAEITYAGTLQ